jgi:hypothetical protein
MAADEVGRLSGIVNSLGLERTPLPVSTGANALRVCWWCTQSRIRKDTVTSIHRGKRSRCLLVVYSVKD